MQSQEKAILPQRRWNSHATSQSTAEAAAGQTNLHTQPIKTHYTMFPRTLPDGPPPKGPFVIDVRQLRNEFLQLQAVAHPDRAAAGEKLRAEAASARINEAYKTLQSPLLRAQYLLSLRGIDVAEDETAKVEDPELLMEVLEAREAIEDAEDESEIQEMKDRNEERIAESEAVLGDAFARDDLNTAKEEAVRLRYWVNIRVCMLGRKGSRWF
jgi:molecular chaperone HscB